jgi:hypothetical protein
MKVHIHEYIQPQECRVKVKASLLVHGSSTCPVPVHEVGGESHVGPKRGILMVPPHLSLRPWVTPGG